MEWQVDEIGNATKCLVNLPTDADAPRNEKSQGRKKSEKWFSIFLSG